MGKTFTVNKRYISQSIKNGDVYLIESDDPDEPRHLWDKCHDTITPGSENSVLITAHNLTFKIVDSGPLLLDGAPENAFDTKEWKW